MPQKPFITHSLINRVLRPDWRRFIFVGILLACTSAWADSQQTYLQCLTNFETYAESIWHTATYSGAPADSGYWGDGGSTGNGGIRGNSGVAVAYAVLVVAQPTDPKTTTRLSRIRQALNYDAATHVSGSYNTVNGNQWGWSGVSTDWQTPEWAGSMGLACILVQSNLPAATVDGVRRVVVSEADHRASIAPASGYVSDTKAEENAWQGNILALAAAWMSTSNNVATWLNAAKSYLVNTYTVPNTNGDPLASWVTTQTLFPSYALENHGFYHPTYEMVAGMSSGDSLLMARLGNTNIAAQLLPYADHNCLTVWNTNLDYMLLDSGEFGYPSGLDWELHDYEQNSYITWMAAHLNDPFARWADDKLAQLQRYRQIINGDGTFVGPSSGGFYREAVAARRTAIAWLHWANADYPVGVMSNPPPAVVHFPDVGVIAQRSAWSYVTISYKNNIMGMVEAAASSFPTNTFVTTPALPGGFGHGPLGNPTAATLVSLTTNSTGFTAQLLVQNGANGTTRVFVTSSGESIGIVEVPLPATGITGSAAGCFTNGIENDPLCGGSRLLEWTGGSSNVTQLSGVGFNVTNNWVCVAGRYGLASGPGGYFRYKAASGYNRLGAAQDFLHLMPQTRLGPRYAVWFPGKSAAQTATLASQISWTTNGSTVVLNFPGANTSTQTITASLVSSNGTWSADASGNWSDSTKWSSGIIADGAGNTADFSTLNFTADRTVTLDSSRNIGTLKFGDASGTQNWTVINSGGSTLTLNNGSASPAIVVVNNTATLALPVAGAGGFTKSGPGTLVLSGTNSLSGTLNMDTSSGANDGAVRIAQSASVANVASPIYIKNNNGGSSTLQLDGSSGNVTVAQDISLAGRNAAVIAIQNLSGSNTLARNFILTSGGGFYWFDSDTNGTLNLTGQIPSSAPSVPNARTLTFMGTGNFVVSGVISNANGFAVSVVKSNSGALMLNGVNTYTGATTVNGGTLAGNGVIAGPVTMAAGSTLSPGGNAIGALTINNALTNNGTFLIRLSRSGGALTNDSVKGVSTLAFGGLLQLVPSGDPITVSNTFKIFSATNYRNFITGITPAVPGTNLLWNTNNLAVNGTLSVSLGTVKPQVGNVFLSGTNLVFAGGGGAAGYGFSVLASTSLTAPLTNWFLAGTGFCDGSGNFIVTNGLSATNLCQFYLIRIP
jgi:autotransporter-associated beta strand protein